MNEDIKVWHIAGVVTLWAGTLAGAALCAWRGDHGILVAWFISLAICVTFWLILAGMKTDHGGASINQAFQLGKEAERRHPSGPRGV